MTQHEPPGPPLATVAYATMEMATGDMETKAAEKLLLASSGASS